MGGCSFKFGMVHCLDLNLSIVIRGNESSGIEMIVELNKLAGTIGYCYLVVFLHLIIMD